MSVQPLLTRTIPSRRYSWMPSSQWIRMARRERRKSLSFQLREARHRRLVRAFLRETFPLELHKGLGL